MAENVTGDIEGDITVTYKASFDVKLDDGLNIEQLRREVLERGSSVVVVEQGETARCQVFADDLQEIFSFVKQTGRMIQFLGTAHALTRKVLFHAPKIDNNNENADLQYPYCTELLILKDAEGNMDVNEIQRFLGEIGDSVVAADGDDMVKYHVHTDVPEQILARKISSGYLVEVKIENMKKC